MLHLLLRLVPAVMLIRATRNPSAEGKQQAKVRRRPLLELRREFLFQRFLARVFSDPASPWVLKGGAGLLIRFPGARYSRDLDLLYRDTALDLRAAWLRSCGR